MVQPKLQIVLGDRVIESTMGTASRYRLWRNETLPAAPAGGGTTEFELSTSRDPLSDFQVALEVSVPSGPMTRYGLLGMEYRSVERTSVAISHISNDEMEHARPYADSLGPMSRHSVTRCGLPSEHVGALRDEFMSRGNTLSAGQYGLVVAAFSPLGSSNELYVRMLRVLLHLMEPSHSNEQQLIEDVFRG